MAFRLYNSLSKKVEEFQPLDDQTIRIYTCGPTVYERAHIGNLVSFIYADTLKRTLKLVFPDHRVKHVMNITDVDDKTIAKSRAEYPDMEPAEALKKLTRHYEELFMKDLEAVGIDTKDIIFVRATDSIESMQNLIRRLVEKGMAYITDDGIYFSIAKYQESGKKYGQLVEVSAESAGESRVNNDEYDKENARDFALWKAQKEGEPGWDFEVGGKNIAGRPGWHIECSAMSTGELGQPFDIHTGGVDLMFPHHENEIAQSTAAGGDKLAEFFFHSEHILIDGQKMSKSLNNFYILDDIKAKGFDPLAFRLLILQSHYRSQAHFSWDNLAAAQNRLRDLRILAANQNSSNDNKLTDGLTDDLNTPLALATLGDGIGRADDQALGLALFTHQDITETQQELVDKREAARQKQDWAEADRLRLELEKQKIGINDTDDGPVWYRL